VFQLLMQIIEPGRLDHRRDELHPAPLGSFDFTDSPGDTAGKLVQFSCQRRVRRPGAGARDLMPDF
jgi:hypothetical protein